MSIVRTRIAHCFTIRIIRLITEGSRRLAVSNTGPWKRRDRHSSAPGGRTARDAALQCDVGERCSRWDEWKWTNDDVSYVTKGIMMLISHVTQPQFMAF